MRNIDFFCSIGIYALISVILAAGACNGRDVPLPPGEWQASDIERERSPDVTQAEQQALVAGNTAFSLDLYQELRAREGNLIYSPLSISMAMTMLYPGAEGETETQMADALDYQLPEPALHQAFDWLDLTLAARGDAARGASTEGLRFESTNALFLQRDFEVLQSYLDTLARFYGAGVSLMDFMGQPEQSRLDINTWVEDVTEERIVDLLPPSVITPDTALVLVNAVYFRAAWKTPFDQDATYQGTFHAPAGDVTVPMMQGVPKDLLHAAGEGYQAIALPYQGDAMAMILLLPDPGTLEAFEASLTPERLASAIESLAPGPMEVHMPRFGFRTQLDLGEMLSDLGMPIAFGPDADFSGINGTGGLWISAAVHQGFIDVNEAGTEAAAATAVVVERTSVSSIELNRPFLFLIQDRATGSILFQGRVVDPSATPA